MAKEKGGGKFRKERVYDMPDSKPFLVVDAGYFVWVRPPVIDGVPNEKLARRVLCTLTTERNGTGLRLCAVRVPDRRLADVIRWESGIVLSQLTDAFGVPKHPEVYVERVYDDELGRSVRVTRSLDEKKPKGAQAPQAAVAGHL